MQDRAAVFLTLRTRNAPHRAPQSLRTFEVIRMIIRPRCGLPD